VHLFIPKVVKAKRKVYLYSKGDYISLQYHANSLNWKTILGDHTSVNDKWEKFKTTYEQLVEQYIPSKLMKPGYRPKSPWLSDKLLKKAREKKRTAKVTFNKSNLHADKMQLNEAEHQYKQQVRVAKAYHEEILARDVKDNPRRFYNYTKNYTKPKSSVECLIVDGKKITDDGDKAEALNNFFASVMTQEPDNLPLYTKIQTPKNRVSLLEITEIDIINVMQNLRPHKAVGPDGIHPYVLKETLAFAKPLLTIFNQSIDDGVLPTDCITANI
jgi:hypothetical protein